MSAGRAAARAIAACPAGSAGKKKARRPRRVHAGVLRMTRTAMSILITRLALQRDFSHRAHREHRGGSIKLLNSLPSVISVAGRSGYRLHHEVMLNDELNHARQIGKLQLLHNPPLVGADGCLRQE